MNEGYKKQNNLTKNGVKVTIDHTLNKYDNVILAPKKVAKARRIISQLDLSVLHEAHARSDK